MELKYPATRRVILKTAFPFLQWVGRISLPLPRALEVKDSVNMQAVMRPGDVLLSYARGHLSNLIIPGDWKHVAMYVGDNKVIEALGAGVKLNDLTAFVAAKDRVCVLRPTFCDQDMQAQAVIYAKTLIGQPYDFLVEYSTDTRVNKAFYCSEVPWWSYDRAMIAAGQKSSFEPRMTMGVATVTPQDYANAANKWNVVGRWPNAIV